MEGGGDHGQQKLKNNLNILDDNPEDEGGPSHEEIDIDQQNPFQIKVILDVLFKMQSFEDLKKCRLVSSAWNQLGFSELCRRPQKAIQFNRIEELGHDDDKLGELIQLQRRHNQVFSDDNYKYRQFVSNFYFDISALMRHQLYNFLDNFSPKFVELHADEYNYLYDQEIRRGLCKFLVKISPTIQEIKYSLNKVCFDERNNASYDVDLAKELTSTRFPNLRKISYDVYSCGLNSKLFFYPLIGQNSPQLNHLKLRSITEESLGSPEFMKEQFEQAGLLSKLKILSLFDDENENFIKIFTQLGQNGVLKLTKLTIKQDDNDKFEQFKEIHVPLMSSQAETLRILKISVPPSGTRHSRTLPEGRILIPFPSLQNLSILEINDFSSFKDYFEPLNFASQTPKLVEFRTCDIATFLNKNLGTDGGSVKCITHFKNSSKIWKIIMREESERFYFNRVNKTLFLNKLYQIFPHLEYMELDIFKLSLEPGVPFRSELKKVVIHSQLKDLYLLPKESVQAKKVDLIYHCGSQLMDENSYKYFFAQLMMAYSGYSEILDHFSLNKYYQLFLSRISKHYTSLHSVSFTFIGYNISEGFKRDFGAILHHSAFISTPFNFKLAHDNYYVDR